MNPEEADAPLVVYKKVLQLQTTSRALPSDAREIVHSALKPYISLLEDFGSHAINNAKAVANLSGEIISALERRDRKGVLQLIKRAESLKDQMNEVSEYAGRIQVKGYQSGAKLEKAMSLLDQKAATQRRRASEANDSVQFTKVIKWAFVFTGEASFMTFQHGKKAHLPKILFTL